MFVRAFLVQIRVLILKAYIPNLKGLKAEFIHLKPYVLVSYCQIIQTSFVFFSLPTFPFLAAGAYAPLTANFFNKSSIIIAIFIVIVNIIDFCIKNKSKKAL